jgi:hypothetical protein
MTPQVEVEPAASPPGAPLGTPQREEGPFIPTKLQKRILDALCQKALTLDALTAKVKSERRAVHRAMKQLRDLQLVAHKRRLGYFRPDAPPPPKS